MRSAGTIVLRNEVLDVEVDPTHGAEISRLGYPDGRNALADYAGWRTPARAEDGAFFPGFSSGLARPASRSVAGVVPERGRRVRGAGLRTRFPRRCGDPALGGSVQSGHHLRIEDRGGSPARPHPSHDPVRRTARAADRGIGPQRRRGSRAVPVGTPPRVSRHHRSQDRPSHGHPDRRRAARRRGLLGCQRPVPVLPDRVVPGGQLDPVPGARLERLLYVSGFDRGWAALRQPRGVPSVGVSWHVGVFPHAWIWLQRGAPGFPWYGRADVVTLEPQTAYPFDGLAAAIGRNQAHVLQPEQSLTAWLTVSLFDDPGVPVARVRRDGTVDFTSGHTDA